MSVFTPLTDTELTALLAPYGYRIHSAAPASHGIENTNYLLRVSGGDKGESGLVLTILEHIDAAELPWFTALLAQLAAASLPVPAPVTEPLQVAGKPALLVPWLTGVHVQTPSAGQCRAIGQALGRLHQCPVPGLDHAADATGLDRLAPALELLPPGWVGAARDTLDRWQALSLPECLIHGDLFRDNALFDGDRLTGLLDFYAAGRGPALYDLAVALNDWCMPDNLPDTELEDALLAGYESVSPLDPQARDHLPLALSVAALRFWLSRMVAEQRHLEEELPETVSRKDPAEFQHRFQTRLGDL